MNIDWDNEERISKMTESLKASEPSFTKEIIKGLDEIMVNGDKHPFLNNYLQGRIMARAIIEKLWNLGYDNVIEGGL